MKNLSIRKIRKAGEKLFVDYAGQTITVEDQDQRSFQAQIFVVSLGASHYSYVETSGSPNKQDWLMAHVRAVEFMVDVTEMVVPDNLKSGVTRPCRYETEINPSYQELGHHYELAICPARVRKPKDKAIAEGAVLVAGPDPRSIAKPAIQPPQFQYQPSSPVQFPPF